ncbi:hypothetical protein RND81_12G210000 [Saponaria officinalis]|uniref:Uncharacterized protein n=1 Tax=Saponaria officinalis TaxID=3572 RepID=A0AAW1HDK7_SAPOF
MRDQLLRARLALYDVIGRSLIVCSRVLQIIEVAELRRTALGFRFINRNHLIWAFYECGFGLPLEIRDTLDLPIAEEDHPPYIIYLTSKNLATSFGFPVGRDGEKKLDLEHFVFSIFYAKDILVEENQVKEMEEHFKTFMEVVALDALLRSQSIDDVFSSF